MAGRKPTPVDLRRVVEFIVYVTRGRTDVGVTIAVVRRYFNLSAHVATRVMGELVDGGYAELRGRRGGAHYVLTGKRPEAPKRPPARRADRVRAYEKTSACCPDCGVRVVQRGPCGFCVEENTGVPLLESPEPPPQTAERNRLDVAVDTAVRQRVG